MAVEIRKVETKKDLKTFIDFHYDLYAGSPYDVPNLYIDERNTLDKKRNAAFDFCRAEYFLAYKDGKVAGRVAAIINNRVNKHWNRQDVRFGWIDFIDDLEVSRALFDAVAAYGRENGMTAMVGPLGFSDMDPEGMLIEGFDQLSTMATIYNHPYYPEHIAKMGFEKSVDWVEFRIKIPEGIPEKHQRISEIIRKKYGVRNIYFNDLKSLVNRYGQELFRLINEAYDQLHGYSPLSPRQIDHYIKMYVPVLNLNNVSLIVDADENLVGVGISMPSMSKALIKSRGRLFPTGWIHLLKALKGKNDTVDLMLVAVKPEYQSKGVNALLFSDLIPNFIKNGYEWAESNPELELNQKVQSQWQYFETHLNKRRRCFIKPL